MIDLLTVTQLFDARNLLTKDGIVQRVRATIVSLTKITIVAVGVIGPNNARPNPWSGLAGMQLRRPDEERLVHDEINLVERTILNFWPVLRRVLRCYHAERLFQFDQTARPRSGGRRNDRAAGLPREAFTYNFDSNGSSQLLGRIAAHATRMLARSASSIGG